ncbi:Vacuolar protein sorting-associated protein vps5 [Coemansia brasiliensis]|uniref:Vacuolar protein sorting-associated protein vps5 n=1 Tax=Coemansia brasiliensis TaxID=2650707 RepID=A0A9W8IDW5_9FUNG|nr:Vacuolar protein sorting-associated protein vps5 [Coemansia brasiliensis]
MESDDLFGSGFGTTSQQRPFSFSEEDMNPFGDPSSLWNDVPATQPQATPAHVTPESKHDNLQSQSSSDTDSDAAHLHETVAEKLLISKQKDSESDAASAEYTAGAEPAPEALLSQTSGVKTSTPLSARRVGVIKRGLRSPRVLGKQLSPAAFQDPLSSAAASTELNDPPAAASRASIDVSPSSQRLQATAVQQSRQTRSMSETRPKDRFLQTEHTDLSPHSHPHPHPYDQQLSPPLQHEQITTAQQHVEGARSPSSLSSGRRASTASGTQSRSSAISRTYLGTHQRRKSLDPTPADEMPHFNIQVTEPVKVSDSLKSYIAYKVITQSDAVMFRESSMVVRRRYRDFDWLIQELVAKHPGIIVPAIPEKQSMGRFEDEFVEARRAGLESCLTRISQHPVLWCDDVFRLFLEADDFASKARSVTEARVAAEINGTASSLSSSGGGLFGDGWGSSKYKEKDEWFSRRMQELDAIEEELRALLRALEYGQRQRQELSIAHGELGEAYLKMAGQELSKGLANGLTGMGSLQQRLKVLQSRQGVADFAAFQLTTDEYIRMIGSVRSAFSARARAHNAWQTSLSELLKKRRVLEGFVQHPGRASPERLTQLKGEIARAEIRTETSRNAFDDVSQLLKQEVMRFDVARVRDFQTAIEKYLTSLIETQEEIVVLWETYLASLRAPDTANA